MKTISIRDVSGASIAAAGTERQPLGITNAGALCGILIPVDPGWVNNLVEWNLSRIVRSAELGEKSLDNGEILPLLSDVLRASKDTPEGKPSSVRKVSIRELSGGLIAQAAEHRELLFLTIDRALSGVIVPVTPDWIQRLVEQNLSRVIFNVEGGEKDLRNGAVMASLDDIVDEDSVATA